MNRTNRPRIPGLILGATLSLPLAALAQETVEEVIVTGTKMSSTLQDTYQSVGYVGAVDIKEAQLRDFADVFRLLPNVRVAASVDSGFVIRGINSQGIGVGSGALGTLYIDGVAQTQQSSRRGANGLWDVEAIEVFRGPHSTLSGRNSLAGAIYVRTKDPTFSPEGDLRVQGTDDDGYLVAGAYSAPITESLAFRVAGSYNRADDWYISYPAWVDRPEYDLISTEENYQVRAKLLYQPNGDDGLKVLWHAGYGYYRIPRGVARGTGGNAALAAQYGVTSVFDRADYGQGFFNDFNSEARYGTAYNTGLEITYPLHTSRGTLLFTSLTTYTYPEVFKPSINGRFMQDGGEIERELTQEFRANFQSAGGKFVGVMGVYALYGNELFYNDTPVRSGNNIIARRYLQGRERIDSYALFGEGTYRLFAPLRVVLGGRVNYESDASDGKERLWAYSGPALDYRIASFQRPADQSGTDGDSYSETVFLPKAGLIHDLTENSSLGFTFQRGYRSGGSGLNITVNPAERYEFDAEYTDNVELAYRSTWFASRLIFNANLFHTDWTDQQIPFRVNPTDPIAKITNAGKSRLYGAELEARFVFSPTLSMNLSYGLTETEFVSFIAPSNIDFSGKRFPEAPKYNVSGGLDYAHASGWFARADFQYTSKFYSANLNARQTEAVAAGDYLVTNLNLGYAWSDYRVTLFGRNVFDEDVILFNGPLNDDQNTFGRPRQIGLTVDMSF